LSFVRYSEIFRTALRYLFGQVNSLAGLKIGHVSIDRIFSEEKKNCDSWKTKADIKDYEKKVVFDRIYSKLLKQLDAKSDT